MSHEHITAAATLCLGYIALHKAEWNPALALDTLLRDFPDTVHPLLPFLPTAAKGEHTVRTLVRFTNLMNAVLS